MSGLVVSGLVTIALLLAIGYQDWRINDLKDKRREDVVLHKAALKEYADADKQNQRVMEICRIAGEERIAEGKRKKDVSDVAVKSAIDRTGKLEKNLEGIHVKSKHIQLVNDSCPAADDPAFIDFLCSGPIGCEGSG